ncbi:MAG: hypothetical protein HQM15_09320 [Deltaproteobacteria bacterium]|nr:hypothetical protein [Deltaproteobacteria bacterium]
MKKIFPLVLLFSFFLCSLDARAESPQTVPASQPVTTWHLIKKKELPNYRIEIWMKENAKLPLGIESSSAKIFNKEGKLLQEVKDLILEPDPKENVEGWSSDKILDLDGDGQEDLLLKGYSGGSHCCYQYHVFSLGKILKKMGTISLKDCGEKIEVKDLNGDKIPEIISCSADFTNFKQIPYSVSPFPPRVFSLKNGSYVQSDQEFPQVYEDDAALQKAQITKEGFDIAKVLQLTLDQLILGKEEQAWKDFDQYYKAANKEKVKAELQEKWSAFKMPSSESKMVLPSGGVRQ